MTKANDYDVIDGWLIKAKEGHKTAAEMLLMTFKPLVLSIIDQMKIPPEDRDDAFQDGTLAFLEGIQRFDLNHGAGFNAFIKTHLKHYFRKRQSGRFNYSVRPEVTLNALIPGSEDVTLQDTLVDDGTDLEGDYIEKMTLRAFRDGIRRGLKTLTRPQMRLILAHYYEGIPLRECARKWGVSTSSVRTQHKRALEKIKKFL